MEGEIAEVKLGEVGKFDVEFKEGKLVLSLDAGVAYGSAGLVVKVDAAAVLDALAAKIPGTVDDAIIGVIKAALAK